MKDQAEIKGTTIQARLEYIREQFGQQAEEQARSELRSRFGADAVEVILPISWYPLAMDDLLCRFVQRRSGDFTEEPFRKLGVLSAQKHIKYFQNILGQKRDPISFLEAITHFHNTYDRGWGKMVLEKRGEREADLRIPAPTEGFRSHCASTVAYLSETFRMVSGASLHGEEPNCRAWGHADCVWRFKW